MEWGITPALGRVSATLWGVNGVDEVRQNAVQEPADKQKPRAFTFFGCYEHSLDGKGRLIIPNAYRKPLGDTFTISITPEGDGIALYPEEIFDEMLADLYQLNRLNDSVRRYLAYLGKMSYRGVEADSQGRILIPAKLRQRILGEARELEISGGMDHVRIYDALKGGEEDDFFDANRDRILSEVSELKAGLMARKGEN